MRHCLTLVLALIVGITTVARAAPVGASECALSAPMQTEVQRVWQLARPRLTRLVEKGLTDGNPNVLYQLEEYTHPLIGAARDCGRRDILTELCELYQLPFDKRTQIRRGRETFAGWACSGPACPSWPSKGKPDPFEVILYSAQFLYGASALVNAVGLVPEKQRTPAMREFINSAPYIAATYERWLDSRGDPLYPGGVRAASQRLLRSRHRVDDKQLQIAGGAAELLRACERDPGRLGVSNEVRLKLRDYVDLFWQVIGSRTSFDRSGRATFDEAWGTIARSKCASHVGPDAPTARQCRGVTALSLDLGHFVRVPRVLETYERCGYGDGARLLAGLARQFSDRVFIGDFGNPRFYNYFSGEGMRGWYNRTFDRAGNVRSKGWAPLALSNKGPLYFGLALYSKEVARISSAYVLVNPDKLTATAESTDERLFYVLAVLPGLIGVDQLKPAR